MYRIAKTFRFEAAHKLMPPYEGECCVLHGHSYRVEVVISGEMLNLKGMVVDFSHLSPFKEYLRQNFDHCMINDIIAQPTAENIARHLYDWCKGNWDVERVRVWETADCWGEYGKS